MDFLRFDLLHIIPAVVFLAVVSWIVFSGVKQKSSTSDESRNYAENTRFSRIRIISLLLTIIFLAIAFL